MRKNRTFRPHSQRPRFPRSSGGRSSGRFTRDYRSEVRYNRNTYITAPEVRLIGSDGENVGVVDIKTALERAREEGLDLVEVAPNAQPPVCRIIPWSKFLYEQKKKEKEARKNKQKEMKEFRFGTFIAEGDKERQVNRAKEFLDKGHNVKLTVWRKGRTPIEHSKLLLNDLLTRFAVYSTIDVVPQIEGKQV
ncbi:MAG: translation initiation factor IF-3, partial [Candidatus Dojkabacteria bacterium]|nr:translation initiation factor IF-3 [Candidatus Dojkabacteria bacterium]